MVLWTFICIKIGLIDWDQFNTSCKKKNKMLHLRLVQQGYCLQQKKKKQTKEKPLRIHPKWKQHHPTSDSGSAFKECNSWMCRNNWTIQFIPWQWRRRGYNMFHQDRQALTSKHIIVGMKCALNCSIYEALHSTTIPKPYHPLMHCFSVFMSQKQRNSIQCIGDH